MDKPVFDSHGRKRGRPPGTRNKPKISMPAGDAAKIDYSHADPDTIVSRQLLMLDWAQQAFLLEMRRAMDKPNPEVAGVDVVKLEKLSLAIVKAIEALKKSSDLAGELADRMTPEQLMEAALKKIEGQDLPTLRYAIKRLKAHHERLTEGQVVVPVAATAADAINALEDE